MMPDLRQIQRERAWREEHERKRRVRELSQYRAILVLRMACFLVTAVSAWLLLIFAGETRKPFWIAYAVVWSVNAIIQITSCIREWRADHPECRDAARNYDT
jgi:membrane protein YdbS with pleckstrin-like domain